MIKIVKINGTQLSTKPCLFSEITEDGFILVDENGEEILIEFDTIKEHFCDKIVKIKIEEISRNIVS